MEIALGAVWRSANEHELSHRLREQNAEPTYYTKRVCDLCSICSRIHTDEDGSAAVDVAFKVANFFKICTRKPRVCKQSR